MAVRETLGLWTPCTGASRFGGDHLRESQERLLFNFSLSCFFFSPPLLFPTSLLSSICFPLSIPHHLPRGLEMFHEERIQICSWLWMQGALSPRFFSSCPCQPHTWGLGLCSTATGGSHHFSMTSQDGPRARLQSASTSL